MEYLRDLSREEFDAASSLIFPIKALASNLGLAIVSDDLLIIDCVLCVQSSSVRSRAFGSSRIVALIQTCK